MNQDNKQAYNRGTSLSSPDERIYQVGYVREAVKRGVSVLGVHTTDGVVLAVLQSIPSELMEAESIEKLCKLDDALGTTTAGHVADVRKLVDFARTTAQRERLCYGEPIGVETLTKTITDSIQESTQSGGAHPYDVSLLIGGVENGSGRLFATDPLGAPQEWKAVAIGGHREDAQAAFEGGYVEDLSLEDSLAPTVETLVAANEEIESDELNLATVSEADYETVDEETIAELFTDATADNEFDKMDEHEEQTTDGSPADGNILAAEAETTAAAAAAADAEAGATANVAAVTLDRIAVYPVKSFDAEFINVANVVKNSGFHGDREYAIFDEDDEHVSGRRERATLRIRSSISFADEMVELSAPKMNDYDGSIVEIDDWLSAYFDYPAELRRDPAGGFPDDTEVNDLTVISAGTPDAVASWFDGVGAGRMRHRLRPNLVFDVSEPFWEDHLLDRCGTVIEFSIGRVVFKDVNPCQRCVVPSRSPDTGAETADFRTVFMMKCRETFPEWSGGDRFDHDFRLMVDTAISESL